ncbi:MAG TPA: hypothetical protein VEV41_05835 [Terriglobales bacterium]|nr:hypothetical protein [Terriglobales bacterium]
MFITLAMQIAAHAQPPKILQIYREPLKPGVEAEYDRIESDTARKCAKLRCPHSYLAIESVTGPKEVWWFNAYDSVADKNQVADAWAKNKVALKVLGKNSKRKARLTSKATNVFANYRQDLSAGPLWLIGHGRFLVITATKTTQPIHGTVFEADDGTRFVIVPALTREQAEMAAAAGAASRMFAVRPLWSHPAEEWIAADPEFWRASPLTKPD